MQKDIMHRDTRTITLGIDMKSITQLMFTKAPRSDASRDFTNIQMNILTGMVLRGKGTSVLVIASKEAHRAIMRTRRGMRDTTDMEAVPIERMMMKTGIEAVTEIVMRRMKTTVTIPRQWKDIDPENREIGRGIALEKYPQVTEFRDIDL